MPRLNAFALGEWDGLGVELDMPASRRAAFRSRGFVPQKGVRLKDFSSAI
jgi:hypothetical protein